MKLRSQLVPQAQGEVLEIGIGTGLNLGFYDPARVNRIVGVDPAAQMQAMAQRRAAGIGIPVEMLADMQVGDHEQPVIVFESMNTANLPIPLPMTEIYDIMTSQIALPEGMSYDPQEPKIHINLNQLEIPLIEDEVLLTALETDLASGFINIGVHFTPELLNLLLGGL